APRLHAAQEMADDPACGQHDRIVGVGDLGRRRVGGDVEARFAVRKIESAFALSDRIPRARLKQARRTGMIYRRARPKDAKLLLEALISNARVIGDSSGRRAAQFLEDFPRRRKCEAAFPLERPRDVLDDPPILPRFAGTLDRL